MTAAPAKPAGVPKPIDDAPSRAIAVALPKALQPYARSPMRWRPACEVQVLRDGHETYTSMLAAIDTAQRSICFETYILAQDRIGERFKAALIERARAGVAVRLSYDAVGSFGLPEAWLADLRESGAEVVCFNPIIPPRRSAKLRGPAKPGLAGAPWRARYNLSHRDHRKILVIDDEVAFTGGLNIANEYASVEDGGIGWHDVHCRVRGPVVRDLSRLFRRTWLRAGGTAYPAPPRASDAPPGPGASFARMLENTGRRKRTAIRRAYQHVIKAARHSVLITNAYFLPDRGLRRMLGRAAARGVDVRVIVPGHSDVRLIEWASLYVLRRLAARGVKVLRWRGVMVHAKTAVVDGVWATIGSYNFDAQSRFNNLEVTLEILDPAIGETMARQFEGDAAASDPYDEATWQRLPWWRKAFAWLAFRARRFL